MPAVTHIEARKTIITSCIRVPLVTKQFRGVFARKRPVSRASSAVTHIEHKSSRPILKDLRVKWRLRLQLSPLRFRDAGHRLFKKSTSAPIPCAETRLALTLGENANIRHRVPLRAVIRDAGCLPVRDIGERGVHIERLMFFIAVMVSVCPTETTSTVAWSWVEFSTVFHPTVRE